MDEAGKKLVKVAEEAMMAGIEVCKPGEHFYRIGNLSVLILSFIKVMLIT